jgi:hypothetical protein
MEVPLVQVCAFRCGNVAQAILVQTVRDAPDTKKQVPYCGDHLDVVAIALVREQLRVRDGPDRSSKPVLNALFDRLDAEARARTEARANVEVADGN